MIKRKLNSGMLLYLSSRGTRELISQEDVPLPLAFIWWGCMPRSSGIGSGSNQCMHRRAGEPNRPPKPAARSPPPRSRGSRRQLWQRRRPCCTSLSKNRADSPGGRASLRESSFSPLPKGGEERVAPRLKAERGVQSMKYARRNNPGRNPGPPAGVPPGLEPGGRPQIGGRTKKKG